MVLTKADADRAGLEYSYVAGRITLRENSALDEVGLTATVSRILADAGISCNVIAGSAHDHLFVDWHRREAALSLLRDLLRLAGFRSAAIAARKGWFRPCGAGPAAERS